MVVSQNFSSATSLAMLAPIRTLTSISSFSRMMSEMSFSPSGPSSIPWMTTTNEEESVTWVSVQHLVAWTGGAFHNSKTPWCRDHREIWSEVRRQFPLFFLLCPRQGEQWQALTLMSDMPMVPSVMWGLIWSQSLPMNWCGITNTRIFAPLTASVMSGTAT